MVVVRKIAGGADTAGHGALVNAAIKSALAQEDLVVVSFDGVRTVTSSFINTAFIPIVAELSPEGFKRRVKIVQSTRQINEMIKLRLEDRSPAFWWGAYRITERDLRIPTLKAMASRRGGYISTSELIAELESEFRPQGEDALMLGNRSDSRFSQIVRNLKSHKLSSTSIFARGYAEALDDGMRITEAGRAYLKTLAEEAPATKRRGA